MTSAAAVLASAPVTNWPERVALTLLVVAAFVVVLALMRWGWVRRGRRQADILPLPAVPALPSDRATSDGGGSAVDVPARYLGATRSGDWLDRVVVHGLGVPSAARVTVTSDGVWIVRDGAPDVFAAADQVAGVRHDRGAAGRVLEKDGVLVITWRHGDQPIDLGLRVRDAVAAESLRVAIEALSQPLTNTTSGENA